MNTSERYLVTGALGCIGAWTVKRLIDEQMSVWTYDLGTNIHRLRLIMDDDSLARVNLLTGDITDFNTFAQVVAGNAITHIIHLAALQVPFVRADPVLGARVNVVGMANVMETVKLHREQIRGFVYASSIASVGPPEAPHHPPTLYGVHKQAKEGMARVYWQDYQIPSIGLRPHTVYGPGRDQGVTSAPTKAMLAAAVDRSYRINYGGISVFHHADDMASVFIRAVRANGAGAPVFDVGGTVATIDETVAAIGAAAPKSVGKISHDTPPLAVPVDVDGEPLERLLGPIHWIPLIDGVRATVEHFRTAAQTGKVDVDKILA